jgi:hypothetical protein
MGPLLAAPPRGVVASELVFAPVSSCAFLLLLNFGLYNLLDPPRFIYRFLVMFSFRSVSVQMSSRGSSSDYELRCKHELLRNLDQRTFAGWVEEERIMTRREDMDRSVEEEVKNTSATKEG